jgi:hypothetical protein
MSSPLPLHETNILSAKQSKANPLMSVSDKQMQPEPAPVELLAPKCTFAIQREKTWLDGRTCFEYVAEPLRFKAMKILPAEMIEARKEKHLKQLASAKKGGFNSIKEQNECYYRSLRKDTKLKKVVLTRAKHGWGRVSANDSLTFARLERFSRNTLLLDSHLDFDIENCQATLILQAALDEQAPCDAISEFCEKRKQILEAGIQQYGKTRDEIKDIWTALMNGGAIPEWYDNSLAYKMKKECEKIRIKIKQANPELFESMRQQVMKNPDKIKQHKGDDEKIGDYALRSTMSMWFQHHEVRIVASVLEWCYNEGILTLEGDAYKDKAIFGYIYDGFVLLTSAVEKWGKKNGKTTDELLETMTDIVYEKTGFEPVWKVKQFEQFFDISEQMISVMAAPITCESKKLTGDMSFSAMAEEFEKTNCKIRKGGVFIETNPRTGEHYIRTYQQLKLENAHLFCGYDEKGKKINFIDTWTKNNDEIRIYEKMNVYPNAELCPDNEFNIWTPFAMERVEEFTWRQDVLDDFLEFMKCTICGHLPHHKITLQYDYMMDWLAHLVQRPDQKPGKAPVLISKQGGGKGTFMRMLKRILGDKKVFQSINPERDVWGNFNPMMEEAIVVFLDECTKSKTGGDSMETLKNYITEETMTINNKYIPSHDITSYHRIVDTTNKEDGGVEMSEDDRRFFVMRMSDARKSDMAYWGKWNALLKGVDDSPWKTIYDWLMARDVGDFMEKKTPKTEFQKNLESSSKAPIDCWLEDMAIEWRRNCKKSKAEKEMTGADCLADYLGYCERNGFQRKEFQTNAGGLSAKLNNHEISRWGGETGTGWKATEMKRGGSNNHRIFRMNEMWNHFVEKGTLRDEDYLNEAEDETEEEQVLPEPVAPVMVAKNKVIKQVKGQQALVMGAKGGE